MQVDIRFSPAFAMGVIAIPAGGEIKAEAGAMTSMSGGVEIETKAQGGVMALEDAVVIAFASPACRNPARNTETAAKYKQVPSWLKA